MYFGMLTTNPVIDCALLAWFLAQLIKVILEAVMTRRLDARLFVSSGPAATPLWRWPAPPPSGSSMV